MRTTGSPAELERRRRLAVHRVNEGYSPAEIADVFGVDVRSIRRWLAAFRRGGTMALTASYGAGRPPKLDHTQVKIVHRWLSRSPIEMGFDSELWTAGRVVELIRQAWDITFNHRYLCSWLRANGYTPQKPQRVPRERDEQVIAGWRNEAWPRIQKKRVGNSETCFSSMKVAC
jgi:transposase